MTCGLNLDESVFSVPGTHDIWKRRNPRVLGAYKRHFPEVLPSRVEIPTAGRSIIFYGLDSTQNTELRHRLARGRIDPADLDKLLGQIGHDSRAHAIKILCLHHPLC